MENRLTYLIFIAGLWLAYIILSLPLLLVFMTLNQGLHLAIIIATVMTILFIAIQQIARRLRVGYQNN